MPPGTRVHEYKKNSKTFSVYRATGEDPGAREYHGRAQCLAPWFIECEPQPFTMIAPSLEHPGLRDGKKCCS